MKGEIKPPNECSGRHTYATATWRDTLDCVWPWYGIRPDVDGFLASGEFVQSPGHQSGWPLSNESGGSKVDGEEHRSIIS